MIDSSCEARSRNSASDHRRLVTFAAMADVTRKVFYTRTRLSCAKCRATTAGTFSSFLLQAFVSRATRPAARKMSASPGECRFSGAPWRGASACGRGRSSQGIQVDDGKRAERAEQQPVQHQPPAV